MKKISKCLVFFGVIGYTTAQTDIPLYERIYEQTKCQHIMWNGDRSGLIIIYYYHNLCIIIYFENINPQAFG